MLSIFEQLELISNEFKDSTNRTIATKIIENLNINNIPDLECLASQAYVSQGTITKFCKKLGFSGYREFSFNLQKEIEAYEYDVKFKMPTSEVIKSIDEWILINKNFIENIVKDILKIKYVRVYCSYQLFDCAKYFVNCLNNLSIDSILMNNEFNFSFSERESLNILIIAGRDTKTLIDNFVRAYNKNNKNYLITTLKQVNKINLQFDDTLLINYKNDNSKLDKRFLAITMLFFNIINKI